MKLSLKFIMACAVAVIIFTQPGSSMDICEDIEWMRQGAPILLLVENHSPFPLTLKARKLKHSENHIIQFQPHGHPDSVKIINAGEANAIEIQYFDACMKRWTIGAIFNGDIIDHLGLSLFAMRAYYNESNTHDYRGVTYSKKIMRICRGLVEAALNPQQVVEKRSNPHHLEEISFKYNDIIPIPFYENNIVKSLYLVFKAIKDEKGGNCFHKSLNRNGSPTLDNDVSKQILKMFLLLSIRSIEDFPVLPPTEN